MLIECIDFNDKVKLTYKLADIARNYLAEQDYSREAEIRFYKSITRTVSHMVDSTPILEKGKTELSGGEIIGENKPIIHQKEEVYSFLDNRHIAPFVVDNIMFNSVESAFWYYQVEDDYRYLANILSEINPNKISKIAKKYMQKKGIAHEQYSPENIHLINELMKLKFSQNAELGDKLLTIKGKTVVYTNNVHDNTGGKCTCHACTETSGKNYIGRLIMALPKHIC